MSDLADFLLARIAEDEAVALNVLSDPWRSTIDRLVPVAKSEDLLVGASASRVLAECEAKRRIVDAYRDERSRRDVYQRDDAMAVEDGKQRTSRRSSAARTRGLEIAVEALALPYADHPDYDEEWRP